MSGRIRMVITVIGLVILLSIISFILLAKFYPPLRLSLFGGEVPISINDIQFWVRKASGENYYKIYARYRKCSIELPDFGHGIFFNDNVGGGGWILYLTPKITKYTGVAGKI